MAKEDENIQIDITDQENEYKAWLAYSKMDFDCAVYLNEAPMHPRPLNIEEIITKSAEISMYASEPRYPNELVVEEQDVNRALRDSRTIIDWVTRTIESPTIMADTPKNEGNSGEGE